MTFKIREDDLSDMRVHELIKLHLHGMLQNSPPGHVFAFDLSGLKAREITVWTLWWGEHVAGIAALKALTPEQGEIKSMRTHPDFLQQGVGSRLLAHIITTARDRGYRRLSLETGTGPAFDAAFLLYRRFGFTEGGAFSNYEKSDFNQFFHLDL